MACPLSVSALPVKAKATVLPYRLAPVATVIDGAWNTMSKAGPVTLPEASSWRASIEAVFSSVIALVLEAKAIPAPLMVPATSMPDALRATLPPVKVVPPTLIPWANT